MAVTAISVRHAAAPSGGRSRRSTRVTGKALPHRIATRAIHASPGTARRDDGDCTRLQYGR